MRNSIKSQLAMLAITGVMMAGNDSSSPHYDPQIIGRTKQKSELTKKQLKLRAKNKVAIKSRQINNKK